MNRFISYLKVILGIALTLNLSLSTALFADPPPPPAPCETEGCYWSLQQSVFSYLFGIEFVEGDPWAYRILDGNGDYAPITDIGQYSGKIHTEQEFSFNCTTYLPVSNDFSALPPEQQPTPEQIQKMVDEGWQTASVAGTVTTALGEVPIIGFALSATPAELGQFVSYFIVVNVLSPDDPLIVGSASFRAESAFSSRPLTNPSGASVAARYTGVQAQQQVNTGGGSEPPGPLDPCQGCEDDYARAIAQAAYAKGVADANAQRNYEEAEGLAVAAYVVAWNLATDTRDIAVGLATTTRNIAVANANTAADAQLLGAAIICAGAQMACTISAIIPLFGWGGALLCYGAALAAYAVAIAVIIANRNATVTAANATLAAATTAANATMNVAIAAAVATRDSAIAIADSARTTALSAAQCAFDQAAAAAQAARAACRRLYHCPVVG